MKKKIQKNRIEIRQNDIDFFFYLHSLKVARTDQINRDAYPKLSRWALYKRLQRLEKAGLIQGNISAGSNYQKVFNLTKKTFKKYFSKGFVKRKELKSDAIKHDTNLVDIRYVLLKMKYINRYIAENSLQTWSTDLLGSEMKSFVKSNSDAALEISIGISTTYFALEYELTIKSDIRYQEVIKKYYCESTISRVLYVVDSNAVLEKIIKIEQSEDKIHKAKFFYTTFDELVNKKNNNFINWKGEVMSL